MRGQQLDPGGPPRRHLRADEGAAVEDGDAGGGRQRLHPPRAGEERAAGRGALTVARYELRVASASRLGTRNSQLRVQSLAQVLLLHQLAEELLVLARV